MILPNYGSKGKIFIRGRKRKALWHGLAAEGLPTRIVWLEKEKKRIVWQQRTKNNHPYSIPPQNACE
jgi:hypothetical protein